MKASTDLNDKPVFRMHTTKMPVNKQAAKPKERQISRTHKPDDMTLEQWQTALRRQFGRDQKFVFKNVGGEAFFSDFTVKNPSTKQTYRVAVRDLNPGPNYCSCPDFSTNGLGTCKHIEHILHKLQKKRGAKRAIQQQPIKNYSSVTLRYGQKREVVFSSATQCPEAVLKLVQKYFNDQNLLKTEAYERFDTFLKEANKTGHELRCYEDALKFIAQTRDQANLKERVDEIVTKGADDPLFNTLIKTTMYRYQKEGALFGARAGRCLMADEMGLGKTIQAIAATEILNRVVGVERVLIVCPTSLKYQWKQEIERFSQRPVQIIQGPLHIREEQYAKAEFYNITNYDVIHRDHQVIANWHPDLIILDEAQRIKNWKTRTAQSTKKLKSDYAFVLTGTPLENRLEELHSIVEFIDRHHLGALFRFLSTHQDTDDTGKILGYKNLTHVSQTLKSVLIRRTKKEVMSELPERIEKNLFVAMTKRQTEMHEDNYETVCRLVNKWRRYKFLSERERQILLLCLTKMRMVCDSSYLLDKETDESTKFEELVNVLENAFESNQGKVVIFSQWTRTHELIIRRLQKKKWGHLFFHGGVSPVKRKDIIQSFKTDDRYRILLSTDAGGVGLNLQNASTVINMDLPWNPAVLEQRIGRVHRLGQKSQVNVINFVSQGTIEHGMLSVLANKKNLFAGVIDGEQDNIVLDGNRLGKFMETVEKITESVEKPATPVAQPVEVAVQPKQAATQQTTMPQQTKSFDDLLSVGIGFLEKLKIALSQTAPSDQKSGQNEPAIKREKLSWVDRDEKTGESFIKIPMPRPEMIEKISALLAGVVGG